MLRSVPTAAKIGVHTNAGRVYGYEILLGFGVGAYLQAGYSVIQGILDPIHMSYGVTFMLLGESFVGHQSRTQD